MPMKRESGILLSVTSLPSKYGIGCFDENAYRFVNWLAEAGQAVLADLAPGGNQLWRWRLLPGKTTKELLAVTTRYARANWQGLDLLKKGKKHEETD